MNGISIIILSRNNQQQLNSFFENFLKTNEFEPVEFIIIDHGSTDSTQDILSQYSSKAFIRLIKCSKNKDILSLANLGASKAEYPYLLFFNIETEFTENFLSQSQLFKKTPDAGEGIVYATSRIDKQNLSLQCERKPLKKILPLLRNANMSSADVFFKKEQMCLLCSKQDFKNLNREIESKSYEIKVDYSSIKPLQQSLQTNKLPTNEASSRKIHKSKSIINKSSEYKKAEKTVKSLRYKLFNLGFIERAYQDLEQLTAGKNPHKRLLAARELALWHANKRNEEHAQKCLEWLAIANEGKIDLNKQRQATVLEAEALNTLGKTRQAQKVIEESFKKGVNANLYLAMANLDHDLSWKLSWINKTMNLHGLAEVTCDPVNKATLYESLSPALKKSKTILNDSGPKVTIIMPSYNTEDTIHIAIDSILNQTWANLELIIVDDCSTDETAKVIQKYEQKDKRIRLIRAKSNAGAYVARNLGLKVAQGEFVTVNDADDWSHPEKIEIQVSDLINNPSVMANTTKLARVFSDLTFYRRGNYGSYIIKNSASLMFRRKQILDKIGYWDCVRFGADADFIERIQLVFGIKNLDSGPLTFARQAKQSLTGDAKFGVDGALLGCRLEYTEARRYHHKTSSSLRYEFNEKNISMFPVPEPMKCDYSAKKHSRRHFDVIIASDFRLPGGTTASNIQEILAQRSFKLRTGLLHIPRYDFNTKSAINPKIRKLLDDDYIQMITYGERISCDLLIVRHPAVLQEKTHYMPDIQAKNIKVIINQSPIKYYNSNIKYVYDIEQCKKNISQYFKNSGIWHPNGPLLRLVLIEHHYNELTSISFSDQDWLNIINVKDWNTPGYHRSNSIPIIGRHSSDQYGKWIENKEDLLAAYPENNDFQVNILGGATVAEKIIGYIPNNWLVYPFDSVAPKDFLSKIDVFVYYPHSGWIGGFDRVPLEAMAAGKPVVLPHRFEPSFKNSAIYAKPSEVQSVVTKLVQNKKFYDKQAKTGLKFVEDHFSYDMHKMRLTPLLERFNENSKLSSCIRSQKASPPYTNQQDNKCCNPFIQKIEMATNKQAYLKCIDDIYRLRSTYDDNFTRALYFTAKKDISKVDTSIEKKIINALHPHEIPSFMISTKSSLKSISSFKMFLNIRSRKNQLGTLPEWLVNKKYNGYKFIDILGIKRPNIYQHSCSFHEIKAINMSAIKPDSGASSKGVYLVVNPNHIIDVYNKRLITQWADLNMSIKKDLDKGKVKKNRWTIEELIFENVDGKIPGRDLKYYCFYGEIALIRERLTFPEVKHCWWTPRGQCVNTGMYEDKLFQGDGVSKDHIELASFISSEIPIPFLRIDFIKSSTDMVFGEFTPRPGGYHKFNTQTDRLLGDLFLKAEERLVQDLLRGKKFINYLNFIQNHISN